jgi:transposase
MPKMPLLQSETIELSHDERELLEKVIRKQTTPQHIALRAKIIVSASDGMGNSEISRKLGINRETVIIWRNRFNERADKDIPAIDRLKDAPRPGAPAKFTPEPLIHYQ